MSGEKIHCPPDWVSALISWRSPSAPRAPNQCALTYESKESINCIKDTKPEVLLPAVPDSLTLLCTGGLPCHIQSWMYPLRTRSMARSN